MSDEIQPKKQSIGAAVPTARSVASRVLVRVKKDRAFAAAALDAELQRHVQLQARDRALTTELVYGVLRFEPWLFARLERHASRGLDPNDVELTAPLLVAAYELAALSRVPEFASVNEAVTLVRARRGEKVAGFANALLRKVARDGRATDAELDAAVIESAPSWLRDALARSLGDDDARAFLANARLAPPLGLRVLGGAAREDVLEKLRAHDPDASFELGLVSPLAILARDAGSPRDLLSALPGMLFVQEEGAQALALMLGAKPGDRVLDACAGRGNKTSLLAAEVAPSGAVDACDVHPQKLDRLRTEMSALGVAPRDTFAVDFTRGTGDVHALYTHILVDAPCSGIGTLRRRPDIAQKYETRDLAEVSARQTDIVTHAAERLEPGGVLLYAACTVLREEAEDVIDAVLAKSPALSPTPIAAPKLEGLVPRGATSFRLLPHVHGTDGYFVASFRKNG